MRPHVSGAISRGSKDEAFGTHGFVTPPLVSPSLSKEAAVTDSGVSVVYEPPDRLEPTIDIIFIHGLQGHPFKTWTLEVHGSSVDDSSSLDEGAASILSSATTKASSKTSLKLKGFVSKLSRGKKDRDVPRPDGTRSVFWPRDLLPVQCPDARILVFGYDTIVAKHQFAGAANKNSVFAHSKNLVNELSRARPQGRPILFVAHSLGGIVVKEMLAICSTSSNEDFENIPKCTAGVVFLGTPHRGSSAAGIGEIARRAASILMMDTNPLVLESLSLKNSDLDRCQDVFSSLWHKHSFRVKTFQEGLPLSLPFRLGQFKMSKVVPDISSCLGDSRERAEILDADHRSMCRYSTASDSNYKKVSAEIQAICATVLSNPNGKSTAQHKSPAAKPVELSHTDRELLEFFRFKGMHLRQHTISSAVENTCQWLPTTPAFDDWINRKNVEKHAGLLQITGKLGSGKSTLMKRLYDTTRFSSRNNDEVCVAGFFFNKRGATLEHSARGLFHALLYQLGSSHTASLGPVRGYSLDELEALEESLDHASYLQKLKSIIIEIFSSKAYAPPRTVVLIDALDECDAADALNTGYFFGRLARLAYEADVKLNICISRREYPSLTIRDSLQINMETYNHMDIRQYIKQKLDPVVPDAKDAQLIQDKIAERSNGIFLWVVLAVEGILKDAENGKNAKYMLERTTALPKALEDLFTTLLHDIDPKERRTALWLFYWATLTTGHLRVGEWHHILAFIRDPVPSSLKDWKGSVHYTETDVQLERQIRSLSQGLVEVRTGVDITEMASEAGSVLAGAGSLDSSLGDSRIVQPIHETVAQFFINGHANHVFGLDTSYDFVGGGHLLIAGTCLDYIGIRELDRLVAARQLQESPPAPLGFTGGDQHAAVVGVDLDFGGEAFTTDEAIPILDLRYPTDDAIPISRTPIPRQQISRTPWGLSYDLPDNELPSAMLHKMPSFEGNWLQDGVIQDPETGMWYHPTGPSRRPPLRHRQSGTSFMSSASAHSLHSIKPRSYHNSPWGTPSNSAPVSPRIAPVVSRPAGPETAEGHDRRQSTDSLNRMSRLSLFRGGGSTLEATQSELVDMPPPRSWGSGDLSWAAADNNNNNSQAGSSELYHQPHGPMSDELFRTLQSMASLSTHLYDPPDLYASLHEEQLPPPPEDLDPSDPDLVPHEQEPRFDGDLYTPTLVRGYGNKREGWCGICKPGRWLVLKNSAYWYDRCFTHGISAVTGHPFREPQEVRRMDGNPDVWEGLCGSCNDWISLMSSKKKGSTWFRHACKCQRVTSVERDGPKGRGYGKATSSRRPGPTTGRLDFNEPTEPIGLDLRKGLAARLPTSERVLLGERDTKAPPGLPYHEDMAELDYSPSAGKSKPLLSQPDQPRGHSESATEDIYPYTGAASVKSQTLEEYPALASYALNRAFIHAEAGFRCDADPKELLEKLVLHDRWGRWYALQEGVTSSKRLEDFFGERGMESWVAIIDQLKSGAAAV